MWTPSVIIVVVALGSIDLSSVITARQYVKKVDCEHDVRTAVKTMMRIYPTLNIKFAACVEAP